ncbi:MAG: hypothetical protein NT067_02840 [Candidatus Diapherotrites archaeon]|nr:hypothetical protein [Candidatus Diapherotrites archaeon]
MAARIGFVERAIVFIVTFAVVVYFSMVLSGWKGELFQYFFMADRWLELVFLLAITYVVSTILQELLLWQYRVSANGGRIRRK